MIYKYVVFGDRKVVETLHKSLALRKIDHTLSYANGFIMFNELPVIHFKRLKGIQLYEIKPITVLGKDNR